MNNMRGSFNPYQNPSMHGRPGCVCAEEKGKFPENASLAMAYIPMQTNTEMYDRSKALCQGTVFPVLDKIFMKSGCRR
ncbi:MAG: spore coat associated protein CotJA [Clostridia bacterium]|nr:spore coat associated protein CotJA [Clostridia bacterium]